MSTREWSALGAVFCLICVVIGFGIGTGQLDYTGVALALIALLTGVGTGLVAKGGFGGQRHDPDKRERDSR